MWVCDRAEQDRWETENSSNHKQAQLLPVLPSAEGKRYLFVVVLFLTV